MSSAYPVTNLISGKQLSLGMQQILAMGHVGQKRETLPHSALNYYGAPIELVSDYNPIVITSY